MGAGSIDGRILCADCSSDFGLELRQHRCPACQNALSFVLERAFPLPDIAARPATMWRYAEALPGFAPPVSLGEPVTPLVPVEIGPTRVLLKCEFALPTGSYKDRGAATLISYLQQLGTREAVEDSSGNAGASMAAYAARAGIRLKVFCPESASPGKLTQIQLHGADLVLVPGARPRATDALLEYVARTGALYASHLWHPLFLEGIRTMAYEICEQLGWSAPDVVLCPVGAGSILLGLCDGFRDLLAAGVIRQMPRLVAVQSAHVAAVCAAFADGAERVEPVRDPQPTRAEGIALPAPVRDREVLAALRESGGTAIAVSEADIAAGVAELGRNGFCVEPTSAVVWKAVEHLLAGGHVPENATVVAVLSGHGLKATAALADLISTDADTPAGASRRDCLAR